MQFSRVLVAALGVALAFAYVPSSSADEHVDGRYHGFGDAGGFMNILPPGQDGVLNGVEAILAQGGQYPPHVQDQLSMYGDLVYNTPGLTEEELPQFFKDASFGVPEDDIDRVYSPTNNVVIIRDKSFGVPHIYGETRYATMFAQGYATAEDRLFLMDALRHVGRARLSEFLGGAPGNQALDRDQIAIAPYLEEDLTRQLEEAIAASGPEGAAIYADLLAYVDGVNKYINEAILDPEKLPAEYPALQVVPEPWIPEDTVAIASLVGGIFGKGGGGEVRNYCGIQQLAETHGEAEARQIFDDLHFYDDPESPATASGNFPYMQNLGPVDPDAVPDIDCDSLVPVDDGENSVDDVLAAISGEAGAVTLEAPWGPITLDFSDAMSNAVLVGGEHTESGHPIAVFGPQTSYYIPQLLVEKDVHGPGIDARGVGFAGTDLYVQLGRGPDYAWSATSASADNVDQFILKLCEPGGGPPTTASMGYEHNGTCEPIETYQHTQIAKPTAGGVPETPNDIILSWRVERTEYYGPVSARGTLEDGTPIAVATLRSTYNNELGSARGFARVNNPDLIDGFESFRQAMGGAVDYTFNWFYIDANDIGYQHSCRCPQRAQGVDPYLPAWGTGEYDWQGFITLDEQPWDLNPDRGYITSWNNRQAHGWMANDRQFYYGPVYRDQMLNARVDAKLVFGNLDRADVVEVMEEAGTVDLRGQEVLPYILEVMGDPPPGLDPRLEEMRDRLFGWMFTGAHRRDGDGDGEYDDAVSPMIMDAWWERVSYTVLLGTENSPIDALGISLDDANRINHIGSAFQNGTFGHVQKDLRQLLGHPVDGPFSRAYCGNGNLGLCRIGLWFALQATASELEQQFGSPNVADWKRAVADEDVRHTAVGVTGVPAIHWINRPTFQQVVQISGLPPAESVGSGSLTGPAGKPIGFSYMAAANGDGTGAGYFFVNDQNSNKNIDLRNIESARSPAGEGCGSVPAGGANTFEMTGVGKINGAWGATIHVCVQDNAEPGAGADRLHVDCSCFYNTSPPYSSEVLTTGNLRVTTPGEEPPEEAAEPSVVSIEPVWGGPLGLPLLVTVTVYDQNGDPIAGQDVSLEGLSALPLGDVTNGQGEALFTVVASLFGGSQTLIASAGGVESNPVKLGP